MKVLVKCHEHGIAVNMSAMLNPHYFFNKVFYLAIKTTMFQFLMQISEVYITVVLMFGGMTVLQTVVTIKLYQCEEEEPIPKWMIWLTKVGMKICMDSKSPKQSKISPELNDADYKVR